MDWQFRIPCSRSCRSIRSITAHDLQVSLFFMVSCVAHFVTSPRKWNNSRYELQNGAMNGALSAALVTHDGYLRYGDVSFDSIRTKLIHQVKVRPNLQGMHLADRIARFCLCSWLRLCGAQAIHSIWEAGKGGSH
jgi:hypothetical protein